MNSKRKADLQRKLSMGAVPRPPAGLAERIKNDIPQYLQAEPERQRFSRSVAFSMRIAASILLLITSVFVTLNLLEPDARRNAAHGNNASLTPAVMHMQPAAKKDSAEAVVPAEEIRLDMTEELTIPKPAAPARIAPTQPVMNAQLANPAGESRPRREQVADRSAELKTNEEDHERSAAWGIGLRKDEAAPPASAVPEPQAIVAQAPELITITAEAPLVDGTAAPGAEQANRRSASSSLVREAYADSLDLGAKKSVFGISVDPEVFHRIKSSLENGTRPQGSVNVEALVNYFAGAPEHAPRRGVRLEVEASPAPVEVDGDHAVLRFTIDTPQIGVQRGASIPPAARDARVEIDFDGSAVSSYHRVGDSEPVAMESVLLSNVSVTALYDVELRPRLKSSQRVATVRLHYRSLSDGRQHTIERIIHGHDLAGDWARASRRHRLASLGAIWGESLKGSPQTIDVVRRAEELVTQNPKDPLARELAHAASATGGERE